MQRNKSSEWSGPKNARDQQRGVVLLSTLVSVLLLITLAVALRQKAMSNAQVMSRLEHEYRSIYADDSIRERLRGVIGDVVSGLPVDIPGFNVAGDPFLMEHDSRSYDIRINDVDGLVDAYLASPALLAMLPTELKGFATYRQAMMESLPPGARYPVLSATLAQGGLERPERLTAERLMTQSSENGQIRVETAPIAIRTAAGGLSPLEVKTGQTVRFRINVRTTARATAN
jgi:hypothetical protein